jgi:LPXTG-site transpeptidase (sortase) family protein
MNAYTASLSYRTKKNGQSQIVRNWQTIGLGILAFALGGIIRPVLPSAKLEFGYQIPKLVASIQAKFQTNRSLPASAPVVFNPLVDEQGNIIAPISQEFSLIVPKVGINAPVIPNVDPTNPKDYDEALLQGVAHASTSFFPNENGLVYLFSHSTNYEWFVKDLNAVFYLLKNLNEGDLIILVYKGTRYTYRLTQKRVVAPSDISYISPIAGKKMLILQTCWPPGSTTERLLVFADLIQTEKP